MDLALIKLPKQLRRSSRVQGVVGILVSLGVGGLWVMGRISPDLVLTVGIMALTIVCTFRIPFVLCLAFISLSFFRLHEVFPFLEPLHLPFFLAVSSIAVLAVRLGMGSIQPYWTRELTILMIFAAHATIGVGFATSRPVAFSYWSETFVKIVIMVIAIAWLGRRSVDLALAGKFLVLCGVLVSCVAIYNSINGIGLVEGTRVTIGRDEGSVLGDPNDLSLILLFPMSFAVGFLLSPNLRAGYRVFGLIAFVIILVAILKTESRGGLLGVVTLLGVFGVRIIRSKLVIAVLGLGGTGLLFTLAGISQRSSGGAAEAGIDESAQGRLSAWTAAFRMARAHPIEGVGLNNFSYNFYFYTDKFEGLAKAVHSTWFGVMAETGFVGLIIFLILFVAAVRRSILSLRTFDFWRKAGLGIDPKGFAMAQAVLAGLASFAVSGSFLTQGFTWPLYLLLAFSVSISHLVEQGPPAVVPA